jgi:hypothetical protein
MLVIRLRTVRAKLVALASISVVVTLIILVELGWLMRTQLLEEAIRSFTAISAKMDAKQVLGSRSALADKRQWLVTWALPVSS